MGNCFRGLALGGLICGLALAQEPPASQPASAPASRPTAALTIPAALAQADQFLRAKQYGSAANLVNWVLERDPDNIEAVLLRSELVWNMPPRNAEAARTGWEYVLKKLPNDFRSNLGMGRIFSDKRNWRQALYYLEIADSVAPADRKTEVLWLLAKAYRGYGDRAKARETVQKSLAADPANAEARALYVNLLVEAEEYDPALTEAQALVRLMREQLKADRSSAEAVQRLYAAYDTQLAVLRALHQTHYVRNPDGRYSDKLLPGAELQAAAELSQMLDISVAMSELLMLLTDHQTIARFGEKMVELGGGHPQYLIKLGQLQRRTYQFHKAAESFYKAWELDRGNPDLLRQAVEAVREALQNEPADEGLRQKFETLAAAAGQSWAAPATP